MSNALHFEFMTELDASIIAAGTTPDKLDVDVAYKQWKIALANEELAMKNVQGNVLTKSIAAADDLRDDYYLGVHYAVQSAMRHYDAATRASAARINAVLLQYGNPVRLSYKAETGILRSLVSDMETKLAADLTKIGASHWTAPLKQANLEVEKLIGTRTDEELAQSGPAMKDARAVIDPLYRALMTRIDALALIKGGTLFATFISKHNARVAYFNTTIAHSGARAKTPEANTGASK